MIDIIDLQNLHGLQDFPEDLQGLKNINLNDSDDCKLIKAIEYYYDNPVDFVQDIIGAIPYREQKEILNALAYNRFVAVKSGHGIGKTTAEAWAIIWFLFTRPFSKVPCTAPTAHQLHQILWPEVGKWLNYSGLNNLFDFSSEKLNVKGYSLTWFAVPRSSDKPENMQGFHAKEVLFIVDEASGVDQKIMEVVEGALTSEGSRLLMCGNPTRTKGTFYNAFHKDRAIYTTLTFSSEKSLNVSQEYCLRIAQKYGKDSAVYKVRVLGEFAMGEVDGFINLADVEKAVKRDIEGKPRGIETIEEALNSKEFEGIENICFEIGVDPARYGDDTSQICIRHKLKVYELIGFQGINTTRLAGEVIRIIKDIKSKLPKAKIKVNVDDTGIGGGVTDQLEQSLDILEFELNPINFGAASNNPDYADKAAELWGAIKEILDKISLPEDNELIAQLATRKYTLTADGKIKLEKKEVLKRQGGVSPDKADALALTFAKGVDIGIDFI